MKAYRKKPVEIHAVRFTRDNADHIVEAVGVNHMTHVIDSSDPDDHVHYLEVNTLEGTMRANEGDWIIRGIADEIYPCRPDIFEATYEQVEQS